MLGIRSTPFHHPVARATYLALIAGLLAPTAGVAQLGRVAIGAKAGTLGFGAEASVGVTRHISVRTGLNRFGMQRDQELGGVSYRLFPRLRSLSALVDLHPFGGAFRLSGGVIANRNEGRLVGRTEQEGGIQIGDNVYASADVQSLNGRIAFKRSAPYAGLGFDNSIAGTGRVSFNVDLGVMFHGHPVANLEGRTRLTGDARARFDQDVRRETADLQEEIDGLPRIVDYYPVVAFGLKLRV